MYTVEHTMYASVYIYSVHSMWFRFVIYKNAVLFYLYFLYGSGLAAATVANIKIRYDAKTRQFAIFGTRVICVFYSIANFLKGKTKQFSHKSCCQ